MIVCPVCENQQQTGDTCDVCGKRLSFAPPTSEQYPTIPDLEQTQLADPQQAVATQVLPELEIHRHGDVAVAPEIIPDLQRTLADGAADAAAAVPTETVPDIERTRVADDSQRTPLSATVTCRYCGHPQRRGGRFCERCSNALPVEAKPAVVGTVAGARCPSCGWIGEPSKACPACGFYIRSNA